MSLTVRLQLTAIALLAVTTTPTVANGAPTSPQADISTE